MLHVQGDVSILGLAPLVRGLAERRSSGLLLVEAGLERRVLRVSPAGLLLVRASRRCHRFERRLRGAAGEDVPTPLPTPEAAARLMGEWMLAETAELLTWMRGSFRFHPFFDEAVAREEGPFGGYGADVDVPRALEAAALWEEELPRLKAAIPDLRHVPVRAGGAADVARGPLEAEALEDVLRLIDGKRPVVQLLEQSAFPRLPVLRMLHGLIREEAVRLAVPPRAARPAAA